MLAPDIALPAMRATHDKYGARIYGMYSFADALNPNNGWVNPDVNGINLGIMLLSAENLRTGNCLALVYAEERDTTRDAARRSSLLTQGKAGGDEPPA